MCTAISCNGLGENDSSDRSVTGQRKARADAWQWVQISEMISARPATRLKLGRIGCDDFFAGVRHSTGHAVLYS